MNQIVRNTFELSKNLFEAREELAVYKSGTFYAWFENLGLKKDYVYRFNAASVKAIICTSDEPVYQHVQDALPESPTVEACFTVNEKRDGFYLLDEEMQSASPELERIENTDKFEIITE